MAWAADWAGPPPRAPAYGDYELAAELFGEGLLFSAEVGNGTNVAYFLEGLATLAAGPWTGR